jgi:hypothetical protein
LRAQPMVMPTNPTKVTGILPWTVLTLILLLQSCLTIEENYTFKKDGSGAMEYVVDMSEMAELLKDLPGEKGKKGPGPDNADLGDQLSALKALPGIKKVKLKKEKDGFVQRMSFQFADVTSLNSALNTLKPDSTGAKHEYFRWEGNTLVRTTDAQTRQMTSGMGGESGDSTDASGILKMMRYKFDLRFADELSDVQVAEGMVKEPDGTKHIKLNTDWSVIDKDPAALDMRFTLKK